MPSKNQKAKKAIDLSSQNGVGERGEQFVVQSYDYVKLQSGVSEEDAQFESDLQYLLSSQESIQKVSKKSVKKKVRQVALGEEPKVRIKRRSVRTKVEEITSDMKQIVLSSDEESDASDLARMSSIRVKRERKSKTEVAESDSGSATSAMASSPDIEGVKKTPLHKDEPETKDEAQEGKAESVQAEGEGHTPKKPATPQPNGSEETQEVKKPKKKKKKAKKDPVEAVTDQAEAPERTPSPSNRQQTAPRKISAAQVTSTILPEKEPVSTIIGLSPQQISTMKSTDVKFKIIMNVQGMSKMCRNVLNFVSRETDSLFVNEATRDGFVELCVHVAMREAKGFQDVSRKNPKLMSKLGEYKELTLEHTKTNYTESHKQAHQNNFDYTVFSYIGHIIIWASWLQAKEKKTPILEGLGITKNDVVLSLGGCHLWDRIRRDPQTINMKRWKHIQKFRQNYAFEEHQFVVILRFMHLGSTFS